MVILDTDLLSLLAFENNQNAKLLKNRLDQLPNGQAVTTVITYEEQTRGWLSYTSRAQTVRDHIQAYGRLLENLNLFRVMEVLPFDEFAAVKYQRLRGDRIRVGSMDLKIAAIALSKNATLLSRNLKDFSRIPGLDVQDWSS